MNQSITILSENRIFSSFFDIDEVKVEHFINGEDKHVYTRELIKRENTVLVLPVDKTRKKVLLTKQFRVGAMSEESPFIIETIAGIVERGEKHSHVAIREAHEEAGIFLKNLEVVCSTYPSPGGCSEKITIFMAEFNSDDFNDGIYGVEGESEFIQPLLVDFSEIKQMIKNDEIGSAPTVIALQYLMLEIMT